jgi:hypothetical protein
MEKRKSTPLCFLSLRKRAQLDADYFCARGCLNCWRTAFLHKFCALEAIFRPKFAMLVDFVLRVANF